MSKAKHKHLCKVVCVGDGAVGKTCLLMVYANNEYPSKYVPTVFENNDVITKHNDVLVKLSLWDTAGQEDYDRLRYLSYAHSHIFLICFSVVSKTSYDNVKDKWLEEVKQHAPKASIVLVGTKSDLRSDNDYVKKMEDDGKKLMSVEDGEKLAKEIGAVCYMDSSARENIGVTEIFTKCLDHFFQFHAKPKKCIIL